jgi:hypothetical protein
MEYKAQIFSDLNAGDLLTWKYYEKYDDRAHVSDKN